MTHERQAVIDAAEALLEAAKLLPSSADAPEMVPALRRYDVTENVLDDAIDAYVKAAKKGKR